MNNGQGRLNKKVNFFVGNGPGNLILKDLDGDYDDDLALTISDYGGSVAVLKNNGDGTFSSRVLFGTGAIIRHFLLLI